MSPLIHIIYSSAATRPFQDDELVELLANSRAKNAQLGITGMLLYDNGSFFQVLEGAPEAVDQLYQTIAQDERHTKAVVIIREPIPKRSFGEWTMGFSTISSQELDQIIGLNDFFATGSSFTQINSGRARKLLAAFREGRWRSKVKHTSLPAGRGNPDLGTMQPATMQTTKVSFAFQPIIDVSLSNVVAYEALICGANNEEFLKISPQISEREWSHFDTNCRAIAVSMAAKLGLPCDLHLNFLARHVDDARSAIQSTLESAEKNGIDPSRIILEIDQDKLIGDSEKFARIIEDYRSAGLRIAIDHFGAGRAGLNLLEPLRPEMICLNEQLVRGIDTNGPRQAIVRGIYQTCNDLGIDLIAKQVETYDEYKWFCEEEISLIQGSLIAKPEFEKLPSATYL
ncbi:diguanylate phosphodiesterase [Nodosilinea sp. E11]|uniref:diguanylate phosphodiesterase n=1 Tax=Nodosilinea sp. E11 TaxID=3037479 RepID=UPI002934DF3F|nr:diguanylate phosphodiesterase [Nodosilinea sp. E11]WOD39771.1 diguanylate phosphodiesterase [Nodosilinea sp. E11]